MMRLSSDYLTYTSRQLNRSAPTMSLYKAASGDIGFESYTTDKAREIPDVLAGPLQN
jgi:hypothetical protein